MCGPLTEYLESLFSLEGRTAVVTGGGGVLCSRMAEALAQAGASVILWDVRQDALDEKLAQSDKVKFGAPINAEFSQADERSSDAKCSGRPERNARSISDSSIVSR